MAYDTDDPRENLAAVPTPDMMRAMKAEHYDRRGGIGTAMRDDTMDTSRPFPPVLNEVACLEKGLSALSEAIELLEQALKEVLRQDDEPGGPDQAPLATASPLVHKLSLANESLAMQMGRLHMLRQRLTV